MLRKAGVWADVLRERPATIRRVILQSGSLGKTFSLRGPAFGFSRFALDRLLFDRAVSLGASVVREKKDSRQLTGRVVLATGRPADAARRANRMFGFKAHFAGPADDAVEVHFVRGGYVGINSVENGLTNICGLASEDLLRGCGFDFDQFLFASPSLRARVAPLSRSMDWIATGPVYFDDRFHAPTPESHYPAGDRLGFIDPFTGSGITNALIAGCLAGTAAARGVGSGAYLKQCRQCFRGAFRFSALLRLALARGWDREVLAPIFAGNWMFRLTRPNLKLAGW